MLTIKEHRPEAHHRTVDAASSRTLRTRGRGRPTVRQGTHMKPTAAPRTTPTERSWLHPCHPGGSVPRPGSPPRSRSRSPQGAPEASGADLSLHHALAVPSTRAPRIADSGGSPRSAWTTVCHHGRQAHFQSCSRK